MVRTSSKMEEYWLPKDIMEWKPIALRTEEQLK